MTDWTSDRFELDQRHIAGAAVILADAMRRRFNRYIECRRPTLSEGNLHANNLGTRRLGPIANLMIGSVATNVIHLVEVPVTLIK